MSEEGEDNNYCYELGHELEGVCARLDLLSPIRSRVDEFFLSL